jgi:hypothetical protein
MKRDICGFLEQKSVQKIQAPLKPDNNKNTLHADLRTFIIAFLSHLLRMKNVSDKSCTEKPKHTLHGE